MNISNIDDSGRKLLMQSHLRLLEICYYVSGSFKVLFISIFLIHFFGILAFSFMPESFFNNSSQPSVSSSHIESTITIDKNQKTAPTEAGKATQSSDYSSTQWVMRGAAALIGFAILCGWLLGGLIIYAGYCIRQRKHPLFIQLMGGLQCIFIPYGTLIGIFSLITLCKPEVAEAFHQHK
jgi:hypothetical protein